jgi:predicted GNAT superfamily acetyltransferase
MTPIDTLSNQVTKAIAHLHKTITEHDRERAAKVFILFQEYLEDGYRIFAFADYAQEVLDTLK